MRTHMTIDDDEESDDDHPSWIFKDWHLSNYLTNAIKTKLICKIGSDA